MDWDWTRVVVDHVHIERSETALDPARVQALVAPRTAPTGDRKLSEIDAFKLRVENRDDAFLVATGVRAMERAHRRCDLQRPSVPAPSASSRAPTSRASPGLDTSSAAKPRLAAIASLRSPAFRRWTVSEEIYSSASAVMPSESAIVCSGPIGIRPRIKPRSTT